MAGPQNTSYSTVSKNSSGGSSVLQNPQDTSYTIFDNQKSLQITIHKLNGQIFLQWSQQQWR